MIRIITGVPEPHGAVTLIRRVKEEGGSVSEAAKDHGVSEASIYSWPGGGAKGAPAWMEFSRLTRERDELLRIVGELMVRASTAQKKSW